MQSLEQQRSLTTAPTIQHTPTTTFFKTFTLYQNIYIKIYCLIHQVLTGPMSNLAFDKPNKPKKKKKKKRNYKVQLVPTG
jgi:hypothetical protein